MKQKEKLKFKVNSGGVANHTEFESKCYIPIFCLFVFISVLVCYFQEKTKNVACGCKCCAEKGSFFLCV